jgi:diacylglycerol kinase family enzyme
MALSPVLLVNPTSGNGKGEKLLESFAPFCHAEAISFPRLSEQLATLPPTNTIVVAGGDGTVSSILSHPSLPQNPTKAVFPLGTANDLGRELGLSNLTVPTNVPRFLEEVEKWPTTSLAIWEIHFNGRKHSFCNYCSIGFEGDVVRSFSEWRKHAQGQPSRWRNRIQYALTALRSARSTKEWELTCPNSPSPTRLSGHTIIISNISKYLGFARLNIEGKYSDTTLETTPIKGVSKYLGLIGQNLIGIRLTEPPIECKEGCTLRWNAEGRHIQVDGEYLGACTSGEVNIRLQGFVRVGGPTVKKSD